MDTLSPTNGPSPASPAGTAWTWNLPNVLSAIRLAASPGLVVLAWVQQPGWCLALFLVLFLFDWLDGNLARWLRQVTVFGARLDSAADAAMYSSILAAIGILRWEWLRPEMPWIAAIVASYVLSVGYGWLKFGRGTCYHTQMAKTSWMLTGIAVVATFADWSVWPLRIASLSVVMTNLEEIAITAASTRWRTDVVSIFHALREPSDRQAPGPPGPSQHCARTDK